jgi:hypothetical protein
MERRVTVNDRIERFELETPADLEPVSEVAEGASGARTDGSRGPCLYLGPTGQRCAKPAVEGGYCPKHHGDPDLRSDSRNYTRVLVATVALAIIIWPYVADLVRDLIRWLAAAR